MISLRSTTNPRKLTLDFSLFLTLHFFPIKRRVGFSRRENRKSCIRRGRESRVAILLHDNSKLRGHAANVPFLRELRILSRHLQKYRGPPPVLQFPKDTWKCERDTYFPRETTEPGRLRENPVETLQRVL